MVPRPKSLVRRHPESFVALARTMGPALSATSVASVTRLFCHAARHRGTAAMQQAIETAPRDGQFVILVEEETGIFEVARWWPDDWFVENGAPITVRPTHWMPLLQDDDVVRPATRANRAGLLSRSFTVLGVLGAVAVASLAIRAGAPFLPKPPAVRSVQLPAAQTAVPKAVLAERAERQVPPAAAAAHAEPVTKGVEANQEQALLREPQRADALARDLATARWEIEARSSRATTDARTAEAAATRQQQEPKEERERAAALTRDLATARWEIEAHNTLTTMAVQTVEAAAARQQHELKQERERAAALTRDLAAARRDIDAHNTVTATAAQAAEVAAMQQRQALRQERERVAALTDELAAARREIQMHTERTVAAAGDSAVAAQAAEAAATRQQQEFKEERERSAALARDLAAARREIDAHNTVTATAAQAIEVAAMQQRQALRQERERVAALTDELAAARREIQVHTERTVAAAGDSVVAAQAAEAAAMRQRQAAEEERERKAGEAVALQRPQALEEEPQRADVPAGELAAARQPIAATTGPADPPATHMTRVETEPTPAPATSNDAGILEPPVSLEAQISVAARKLLSQLLSRADLFLRQGDIGAARVVLERAIEMGSAEASYRLAETYDPRVLSAWRTFGTRGDPAKARELYARAYADGIQQAKVRMNALQ